MGLLFGSVFICLLPNRITVYWHRGIGGTGCGARSATHRPTAKWSFFPPNNSSPIRQNRRDSNFAEAQRPLLLSRALTRLHRKLTRPASRSSWARCSCTRSKRRWVFVVASLFSVCSLFVTRLLILYFVDSYSFFLLKQQKIKTINSEFEIYTPNPYARYTHISCI